MTPRLTLARSIAIVAAGGPDAWRRMPQRTRLDMVQDALDELRAPRAE